MKFQAAIFVILALSLTAHAGTTEDLVKVRQLANKKIMGDDVRKSISVYNNTEGNPCAEDGVNYVVKVQTRKSTFGPNGAIDQKRSWSDLNTYFISKAQLDKGGDLSDSLCGE
ncbi:MAG: hypothetical protein ACXVAX_07250 [Pseudobdellovibrio sp.]